MTERKKYLDVMKFIGMCCLFLAHVQGPFVIEELRGFDVSMMVFISGILALSSIERATSTKEYIIKRIKRLVIPTWIFLTIFYAAMVVIGQKPLLLDVVKSYFFQRDCGLAGGVWIIWVYLICAILTPVVQKSKTNKWLLSITMSILIMYEILVILVPQIVDMRLIYYSVCTVIPYGAILVLGMTTPNMNAKRRWMLCGAIFLIHIVLSVIYFKNSGGYVSISQYKYPARIYYLSYGFPVTLILLEFLKKVEKKIPDFKLIMFVSKHSLWIYLWQIMMLTIANYVLKINNYWFLSWLFLMTGSITITWIQNKIISQLYKKTEWSFWKYFEG